MSVRVLVVDDEQTIANLLARILRDHGYEARAEFSAMAAVSGAEDFQPQVLVADIVMPGMSGVQLAEWFTQTRPDCRVLLTSANLLHFDPSYLDFPNSHRVAFLPKPVHIPELLEFVQKSATLE